MYYYQIQANTPVKHLSSGKLISEDKFTHPSRLLDNNVLIIGLRGKLSLQIEDIAYELVPGNVLFLPARKHHWGLYPTSDVSYYWTHFSVNQDDYNILDKNDVIETLEFLSHGTYMNNKDFFLIPEIFTLSDCDRIDVLFHQLIHYRSHPSYSSLATNYALNIILAEITQQVVENHNNTKSKNTYRIANVLEWIRANYNKNLTIDEVAERFGYNSNYLSNRIAAKTGLSFKQYQHKLRIDRAKYLLTNTDLPIKEISLQIGFYDDKYFMRLFKKHVNTTPSKYRNSFFETYMNIK